MMTDLFHDSLDGFTRHEVRDVSFSLVVDAVVGGTVGDDDVKDAGVPCEWVMSFIHITLDIPFISIQGGKTKGTQAVEIYPFRESLKHRCGTVCLFVV